MGDFKREGRRKVYIPFIYTFFFIEIFPVSKTLGLFSTLMPIICKSVHSCTQCQDEDALSKTKQKPGGCRNGSEVESAAALQEHPGSVPSTRTKQFTSTHNSRSRSADSWGSTRSRNHRHPSLPTYPAKRFKVRQQLCRPVATTFRAVGRGLQCPCQPGLCSKSHV